MSDRRFPRSVYSVGADPDPRFSLANERTFLSWIRTSLAFVAGGVALEAINLPVQHSARITATVVFLLLALIVPVYAWIQWSLNEKALRQNKPLKAPTLGAFVAVLLFVAVAAIAIGLILGTD